MPPDHPQLYGSLPADGYPLEGRGTHGRRTGSLCDKLLALGPKQVVITSVPCDEEHLKIVSSEPNQLFPEAYEVKRLPFATCGTGDVFTSTCWGMCSTAGI